MLFVDIFRWYKVLNGDWSRLSFVGEQKLLLILKSD